MWNGWRFVVVTKDSSRPYTIRTGSPVVQVASAASAWQEISVFPPNAPPTAGETTRTRSLGSPRVRAISVRW